jgi:GNAT superfamily N-acetyltransferase
MASASMIQNTAPAHDRLYPNGLQIRTVANIDLDAVNRVIEAAVMTWALPARVKRLSLPVYRYTSQDLAYLDMVVAENRQGDILGIAAWEEADPKDAPAGHRGLLLHGIYVDPSHHRQGIGSRLFGAAEAAVRKRQHDGLLVKAQQDANSFFISRGMRRLDVDEPTRQFANRFWKELPGSESVNDVSSVRHPPLPTGAKDIHRDAGV